jgi:quercetin dioxygenase-like cupin family protein
MTPTLHRWDELPSQEVTPGIHRRFLTASRVTVARFTLARGTSVPLHAHDHEQISYVVRGALRFNLRSPAPASAGGVDAAGPSGRPSVSPLARELIVRAGEVLEIPSWTEHGVDALEDAEVIDVFSPVRQDWVDGTDTYFRK